jgi:hypothetical protein
VGVQYYRGLVGRGEYVMLRREPTNQYDKNAIQVSYPSAQLTPGGKRGELAGWTYSSWSRSQARWNDGRRTPHR